MKMLRVQAPVYQREQHTRCHQRGPMTAPGQIAPKPPVARI